MNRLFCLLLYLGLFSCQSPTSSKSEEAKEIPPSEIDSLIALQKPLLDSILEDPQNDYLATFEDGLLEICCKEDWDLGIYPVFRLFEMTRELYDNDGQIDTVDVYAAGSSFFKMYWNYHPDVDREVLVYGEITNPSLLKSKEIKLGMSREDFLSLFFQPSALFSEVKEMTLYENEIGSAWTTYVFEDKGLSMLVFDSDYDWVDRKLSNRN